MTRKAAMFDLDGTLTDTLEDLADSMNRVLTDFGMPTHPLEPFRYYVGDGIDEFARRVAPRGTDEATIGKMVARMVELYGANWNNKTKPYPGIVELLDALSGRGVKLAVLSNKPDRVAQLVVTHYFGEKRFGKVFGSRDGVPKKPDPTAAFEIISFFGVKPAEVLYFGDTDTDMKTGRAAGMFTIGVTWGFRPREELLAAGAEAIIDHPLEALSYLDG